MALPIIAAGIAARAVAKKLATRVAGGITGSGAKNVAPVYRNISTGSVKVIKGLNTEAKLLGISKKTFQKEGNKFMGEYVESVKSGQGAKEIAALRTVTNKAVPKKPTVKINSGNMRAR